MRKYRVFDTNYIRKNGYVSDYIMRYVVDSKEGAKFIKGLTNIDKITTETEFDFYDGFTGDDGKGYSVLANEYGYFITRDDNVEMLLDTQSLMEDFYNVKSIIKSGDKTILITADERVITTTRDKSDKYDIEKAVMILLLKKDGYKVEDIYSIIDSVKDNTKKKSSKGVKVSKKVLKVEEKSDSTTV